MQTGDIVTVFLPMQGGWDMCCKAMLVSRTDAVDGERAEGWNVMVEYDRQTVETWVAEFRIKAAKE